MGYAHFDMTMKIGVKLASNLRKMTISRVENVCKPLILQSLQKKYQKISTHLLTVLTTAAILQLEQRKRERKKKSSQSPVLKTQHSE